MLAEVMNGVSVGASEGATDSGVIGAFFGRVTNVVESLDFFSSAASGTGGIY